MHVSIWTVVVILQMYLGEALTRGQSNVHSIDMISNHRLNRVIQFDMETFSEFYSCLCISTTSTCTAYTENSWSNKYRVNHVAKLQGDQSGLSNMGNRYVCEASRKNVSITCKRLTYQNKLCSTMSHTSYTMKNYKSCNFQSVELIWKSVDFTNMQYNNEAIVVTNSRSACSTPSTTAKSTEEATLTATTPAANVSGSSDELTGTRDTDDNMALIMGVVLASLAFMILLTIIAIFFWKHRRGLTKRDALNYSVASSFTASSTVPSPARNLRFSNSVTSNSTNSTSKTDSLGYKKTTLDVGVVFTKTKLHDIDNNSIYHNENQLLDRNINICQPVKGSFNTHPRRINSPEVYTDKIDVDTSKVCDLIYQNTFVLDTETMNKDTEENVTEYMNHIEVNPDLREPAYPVANNQEREDVDGQTIVTLSVSTQREYTRLHHIPRHLNEPYHSIHNIGESASDGHVNPSLLHPLSDTTQNHVEVKVIDSVGADAGNDYSKLNGSVKPIPAHYNTIQNDGVHIRLTPTTSVSTGNGSINDRSYETVEFNTEDPNVGTELTATQIGEECTVSSGQERKCTYYELETDEEADSCSTLETPVTEINCENAYSRLDTDLYNNM